jgi:hypothetical protein
MTQASGTPGAARPTDEGVVATEQDSGALTDAELAIVVGGNDGDIKGDININTSRA